MDGQIVEDTRLAPADGLPPRMAAADPGRHAAPRPALTVAGGSGAPASGYVTGSSAYNGSGA
jgi:hypothetical protein